MIGEELPSRRRESPVTELNTVMLILLDEPRDPRVGPTRENEFKRRDRDGAIELPGFLAVRRAVVDHALGTLGKVGKIGDVRNRNPTFHFGYDAKTWGERQAPERGPPGWRGN
jgi:hypothetical protein